MNLERFVYVVVGPTCSGKSNLALNICMDGFGEIINCDAMQMYVGLPIATNKVEDDFGVPHHLMSFADNFVEEINVHDFVEKANAVIEDIWKRGKVPVIVGGTFYYLRALLFGELIDGSNVGEEVVAKLKNMTLAEKVECLKRVDPASALRIDPNDERKVTRSLEIFESTGTPQSVLFEKQKRIIKYNVRMIRIKVELEKLTEKIGERVEHMMERGMMEECRAFRNAWLDKGKDINCEKGIWQVIGLKEFEKYFQDLSQETLKECVECVKTNTVKYAKKQTKMLDKTICPRLDFVWYDGSDDIERLRKWENLKMIKREDVERQPQTERLECKYCEKLIVGKSQIESHVKGKQHKHNQKKKKNHLEDIFQNKNI